MTIEEIYQEGSNQFNNSEAVRNGERYGGKILQEFLNNKIKNRTMRRNLESFRQEMGHDPESVYEVEEYLNAMFREAEARDEEAEVLNSPEVMEEMYKGFAAANGRANEERIDHYIHNR